MTNQTHSVSEPQKTHSESRNSTLEMFRILCMILIVGHHFGVHGAYASGDVPTSVVSLLVQFLVPCGKIGVDGFVLLTGYFCIDRGLNVRRVIGLYGLVWFYSVAIFLLLAVFGAEAFSVRNLLKAALPICMDHYWFASTYLVLMCFVPFLNKVLNNITPKEHAGLVVLVVGLWSVFPTFAVFAPQFSALGWFGSLYVIGAFIKKYPTLLPMAPRWWAWAAFVSIMTSFGVLLLLLSARSTLPDWLVPAVYLGQPNRLPVLCITVSLFMLFMRLPITNFGWVNRVAQSMFSVYLIHDHVGVRPILWGKLFPNGSQITVSAMAGVLAGSVGAILIGCVAIDFLRVRLWKLFFAAPYARIYAKLEMRLAAIGAYLGDRFISRKI